MNDFKPVYIFGAGTSRFLGGPLVNDFLTRAMELRHSKTFPIGLPKNLEEKFDEVFKYQRELFTTRKYLGIDLDNIETLFSIHDMDWDMSKTKGEVDSKENLSKRERLNSLRDSFFSLIIETLKQSMVMEGPKWEKYKKIIKSLAFPVDSCFITFNYDLALEKALKEGGGESISDHVKHEMQKISGEGVTELPYSKEYFVNYGINESPTNTIHLEERKVLKLHGSINWLYCTDCLKFSELDDCVIPSQFDAYRHLIHDTSKCKTQDKLKTLNLLVPPTWHKQNYTDHITEIWSNTIRELSSATHLLIVGYSFPRTDVFFDQLLTLGLKNNYVLKQVIIINPKLNPEETIKPFFDRHFEKNKLVFIPENFESISLPYRISKENFEDSIRNFAKQVERGDFKDLH